MIDLKPCPSPLHPMSKAPRDGTWFVAVWDKPSDPPAVIARWAQRKRGPSASWVYADGLEMEYPATEFRGFIPLHVVDDREAAATAPEPEGER